MARYRSPSGSPSRSRSRSRGYSPRRSSRSPVPSRRRVYDDYRDRDRDRYRDHDRFRGTDRGRRPTFPTGLLVRNISLDARPEDLRIPFERFGPVKDVYLPKNYYTGEPRGFGFVKYRNHDDAAEAKRQMNHQVIGGREISIVFAEENRKNPEEMRALARVRGSRFGAGGLHRHSPPRSPRHQFRSYSRSASPPRRNSRGRRYYDDGYSPERSVSRSYTPHGDHYRSVAGPPKMSDARDDGRDVMKRQQYI